MTGNRFSAGALRLGFACALLILAPAVLSASAESILLPLGSPDSATTPSSITVSPTGEIVRMQLPHSEPESFPRPLPIAALYTSEGQVAPTSARLTNSNLELTFPGPSAVSFALTPGPGFTIFRLADMNLAPSAKSLRLRVPVPGSASTDDPVTAGAGSANTLNAAFRKNTAFALMSASPEVVVPGADGHLRAEDFPGCTHTFTRVTPAKVGSHAARFAAVSNVAGAGWVMRGVSVRPTLKLADIGGISAWVHGDGKGQQLKFQLIDENGGARDYYLPINFTGWREVSITSHSLDITTGKHLAGLNMYYNSLPPKSNVATVIDDIRAIIPGDSVTTTTLIEDFEDTNASWWTESSPMLQLEWDFKYAGKGSAAAILATAQDDFFDTVREFEKAAEIPVPYPGGIWNKEAAAVRENYLFLTSFKESQFDKALELAHRGGFKRVLILQNSWCKSTGHYQVNEDNFPGGLPTLVRTADRFRAHGIDVGFHTLAASIDNHDPYLTPAPDSRLVKDAQTTLTHDIDPLTTTITVADMPLGFPAEDGGYNGNGTVLQIGDELIHYTSRTTAALFTFNGCARGHLGTKAAPHAAGLPVHHLARSYGYHMFDMDTTLLDEVTSNFAAIANACKIDMVYLDGAERLQGSHGRYNARLVNAFLSKLDNKNILMQASSFSHFSWHQLARSASADGHGDLKGYLEQRAGVFKSFKRLGMPLDIGWYYGYDKTATPDMYEYILGTTLANDSAFSFQVSVDAALQHPFANQILDLIKKYETLRTSGRVSPAMKERLQVAKSLIGRAPEDESRPTDQRRDYRLVHEHGQDTFQRVNYGDWHEHKSAQTTGPLTLKWQVNVTTGPSALAMQLHLFARDDKSTVPVALQNPRLEINGQQLAYDGIIMPGQYLILWPGEAATVHGPTADDLNTATGITRRIALPPGTYTARLTAIPTTTAPLHLRSRTNLMLPERHTIRQHQFGGWTVE